MSQSHCIEESSAIAESWLTRRAFLKASALAVGGFAFGGFPTAALARRQRESELDSFLTLSALVTGTDRLPRPLGHRYLEALNEAPLAMSTTRFLRLAGFADGHGPATLAALRRAPAFRMKGGRATARAVAAAWWSGMVPTADGGRRVITHHDALVWRALPYAQPPSLCLGAPTSWAKPGKVTS